MKSLNNIVTNQTLILICRIVLGAVFIYASIDKIFMPGLFARSVFNYQLMPDFLINFLALWLPPIELVAGLFLIFGFMTRGSIVIISGLLVVFMSAMGINIIRGVEIDCGCFGPEENSGGLMGAFMRDILYIALAIPILWVKDYYYSIDNMLANRRDIPPR